MICVLIPTTRFGQDQNSANRHLLVLFSESEDNSPQKSQDKCWDVTSTNDTPSDLDLDTHPDHTRRI